MATNPTPARDDLAPEVRSLRRSDAAAAAVLFSAVIGGRHQARLGEVHDVVALPGLAAWLDDTLVGLATYRVAGRRAELAAFAVADGSRRNGTGTAILDHLTDTLAAQGVQQLWLVTTNDNVDALRFYQRRGFRLDALHAGAVDRARALKPSIPARGMHGIPMRDELVLIRDL